MEYDRIRYTCLTEEKEELARRLRELLAARPRVKLAFLFGSILRREKVRDVDVAIYTAPRLDFRELLRLGTELEIALGVPVDLVQLPDLGPAFRLKILLRGRPVLIRDRQLYHRLVAAAFSELQDLRIALRTAKEAALRAR